ncbi:MAG: GTPase [Candidatus Parcubacteria bacterium]|jgi:GTP-binding protein|nr:GTPase [Candidatus Parcubacteria bacterium]
MAFVDEVTIHATAGRGGDGVVRWLHMKGKEKGGPSGGDGGRGGDIILEGVRDLAALASYRYTKKFRAENGGPGEGNNKHGKDGEPITLRVPIGTLAKNSTTKESVEILEEGQRIVIFRGGMGGLGNHHFKGAENQNPEQSTPGKAGGAGNIELTLKIIADAGLIGFPNAGKSSILNALTRAKSKVAAYPFTTLDPHLGDFYGHLLADIPGLIEGASAGRGLGAKFLRHIERTALLVHLVSSEQEDVAGAYGSIRAELDSFGRGLSDKSELVILSKTDLLDAETKERKLKELSLASGREVIPLSVIDDDLLKSFSDHLSHTLEAKKAA